MAQNIVKNSNGKVILRSVKDTVENIQKMEKNIFNACDINENFSLSFRTDSHKYEKDVLSDVFVRNHMFIFEY